MLKGYEPLELQISQRVAPAVIDYVAERIVYCT